MRLWSYTKRTATRVLNFCRKATPIELGLIAALVSVVVISAINTVDSPIRNWLWPPTAEQLDQ